MLPTEARVAAMLAHTRRRPDEIVGRMRSTHFREYWAYTVEKVAVNAVMAGARPEYFPVILALAATGVTARSSSSSAMAAMAVVNGPVRHELEMNAGTGAMGPYNHANATIGRAYGLLSQNGQGGSVPGLSYMGNQGNNYAYNSVTFAENEERSPWEPFHVQHGLEAEESAVSVFSGVRATSFTLGLRERYWREHVRNLLRGIDPNGPPTLLLDPIAARQFVDRGGFAKKDALLDWIHDNARMPAGEYWDYQLVQNYIYPRATFGEEPWATWLQGGARRADPDVPARGHPRRGRGRRDERLLAHHGLQLPEDRLGRRLALTRGVPSDHGDISGLAAGAPGATSPPAVEAEIASYDSMVTR